MATKFSRGTYGSLCFKRTGCAVTVFLPENESLGWHLRIGSNVYGGYVTRRAAVLATSNFI